MLVLPECSTIDQLNDCRNRVFLFDIVIHKREEILYEILKWVCANAGELWSALGTCETHQNPTTAQVSVRKQKKEAVNLDSAQKRDRATKACLD
jgi:hypothetical protein